MKLSFRFIKHLCFSLCLFDNSLQTQKRNLTLLYSAKRGMSSAKLHGLKLMSS